MSSILVALANSANRKRYRFEKPRNHSGSGFCYAIFKSKIKKISFPQNDLWGRLELKLYSKSHIFL